MVVKHIIGPLEPDTLVQRCVICGEVLSGEFMGMGDIPGNRFFPIWDEGEIWLESLPNGIVNYLVDPPANGEYLNICI